MMLNQEAQRLGNESAFALLKKIEDLKATLSSKQQQALPIINLGIGQPDFTPAPHICEAAIKAIHDGHHGYTPSAGIKDLKLAVAEDIFRRHQAQIDPDHVLIVPGGKITMFHAFMLLNLKGREVVYPDPGFPIYRSLINFAGAKPVPLKLHEGNDYTPDYDSLSPLINEQTGLVILNSPSNPTGGVIAPEDAQKIAGLIANNPQTMLLSDEIYDGLTFHNYKMHSFLNFAELKDQLILLDGWSKRYAMTGWRLGFGIWPKKLMKANEYLAANSYSCVNAVAQQAALAALTGPQDHISIMAKAFSNRCDYLIPAINQIKGLKVQAPKGAFYALVNCEATGKSSQECEDDWLYKLRIGALAGEGFGENGKGHLRLSFASSLDNLKMVIDRLQAHYQS